MSSRYQSRLFNLVHKQTRRWTEQGIRAFRQIQVSANWIATVALSPIFFLWQSSSTAKQVYQGVQHRSLQLPADEPRSFPPTTAINVDTPIEQALLLVDALKDQEITSTDEQTETVNFLSLLASWRFKFFPHSSKSKSSPLSASVINDQLLVNSEKLTTAPGGNASISLLNRHRPLVRGIATQLTSRTLVLVTAQNETLDILSIQQQQKLQERIIAEVANYWRYQQQVNLFEQRFTAQIQLSTQATTSPPRLLSRLITSLNLPLVLATKFFPQPKLIEGKEQGNIAAPKFFFYPTRVLAFLDRRLALLESNLVPVLAAPTALISTREAFVNPVVKPTWQLVQALQTQLHILLFGKTDLAPQKSTKIDPDGAETHKLQLQTLIWAAIDYFFGSRNNKYLKQTQKPKSKQLKPLAKRPSSKLVSNVDPWLSESDLFGLVEVNEPLITFNSTSVTSLTNHTKPKTNLKLSSKLPVGYLLPNLRHRFQKVLWQLQQVIKDNSTADFLPSKSNYTNTQSTQLESAPDWIETTATAMGYVKHPLEQLLEWLDRLMLWLEDLLLRVWRWLKH